MSDWNKLGESITRVNRGIQSEDWAKKYWFEDTGYSGHNVRDDGLKPDIFLTQDKWKEVAPSARGVNVRNQIVMPSKPLAGKRDILNWEKTYHHEDTHSRQDHLGHYNSKIPWAQREHEVHAEEGALGILKENLERAGMQYTPQTGRDYLGHYKTGRDTPIIENPSKAPFKNRLTYLPVAQSDREYQALDYGSGGILDRMNPKFKTTTNYTDFINSRGRQLNRYLASGLDTRYPKTTPRGTLDDLYKARMKNKVAWDAKPTTGL